MLAAMVAIPAMNSVVFAGDDDCEKGNSGNEWKDKDHGGPHKCPPGLSDDDD